MTNPVSDDRLRNTRAWAAARVGTLSGAEVIVAAIDEVFALRAQLAASCDEARSDPEHGGCPLEKRSVEPSVARSPRLPHWRADHMDEALRQIGAMIPSAAGGTFEGHPPDAVAGALRRALNRGGGE